jgi:hypothetical protein
MKNVVVILNSDGHVPDTHSAAIRAVGFLAVVPLLVLLTSSTAWAGAPILITANSDPKVYLQV